MDQNQNSYRRAAAKAFFDSLDQLQETLDVADLPTAKPQPPAAKPNPSKPEKTSRSTFTLADLEEAAADIEQFMQAKNPGATPTEY